MNVQVGKLVWSEDGCTITQADPVIEFVGRTFTPCPRNLPATMVAGDLLTLTDTDGRRVIYVFRHYDHARDVCTLSWPD